MTMTTMESIIMVGVVVAGTVFTRSIAFIVFPANRPTPPYISYLAKVLPSAVFALLVVYCYKDLSFSGGMISVAGLSCGILTAVLQLWRKNMFLSILVGTTVYMVWIQNFC